MDLETIRAILMWCTLINGGLLILWTVLFLAAPDLVYRTQRWFVPISKEVFTVVMYSFLGFFKVLFLFFNLIPFIALHMVG